MNKLSKSNRIFPAYQWVIHNRDTIYLMVNVMYVSNATNAEILKYFFWFVRYEEFTLT